MYKSWKITKRYPHVELLLWPVSYHNFPKSLPRIPNQGFERRGERAEDGRTNLEVTVFSTYALRADS